MPFISFFPATEVLTLGRHVRFSKLQHAPASAHAQRYFAGKTDSLRPPNNSEQLLVATTEEMNWHTEAGAL